MFKWIKSLFSHRNELVEETRVIDIPAENDEVKVDWNHVRVELTDTQYDDMIAHKLQELIDASKLPSYRYVMHYIRCHYQLHANYEYPVNCYTTPTPSKDLLKIARRWTTNSYSKKCLDKHINDLMSSLDKSR